MSDGFSVDWFSNNIPQIESRLNSTVNKAMEIGCYEGRSSCWFLQNKLFKNAEMYFIDIWEENSLYHTFIDNINYNKWVQQWTLGERLHNNHHEHCHLYDTAVKKGESDFSAWIIERFLAVPGKHTAAGKVRIDVKL